MIKLNNPARNLSFGTKLVNPEALNPTIHSSLRQNERSVSTGDIADIVDKGTAYRNKRNSIIVTNHSGNDALTPADPLIVVDQRNNNVVTAIRPDENRWERRPNGLVDLEKQKFYPRIVELPSKR